MATLDEIAPLFRAVTEASTDRHWQQTVQTAERNIAARTPRTTDELIDTIAPRYNVDPQLVRAVMGRESGGNPNAVSPKNAQGLMQLIPATAKRFGVSDPFDPEQNITGGVRYLAFLAQEFPGRLDLQLAAYNAGEGAVKHYGNTIPPYAETQAYVLAVMARYQSTSQPAPGTRYTSKADRAGGQPPIIDPALVRAAYEQPLERFTPSFAAVSQPIARALPPTIDPAMLAPDYAPRIQPGTSGPLAVDISRGMPQAPAPFQGSVTVGESPQPPANPQALFPGSRTIPPFGSQGVPRGEALEESGPQRYAADIAQGAVQMARSTVEFLPAVEEYLGLHGGKLNISLGTERLRPVFDRLEALVAPRMGDSGPGFLDRLANGIGTSLMSIVPAAAVGRFLSGLASVVPRTARVGAALTAGTLEAAAEAGDVHQQLVPLVGQEEAARRAMHSFALNTVLVTATDKLGIFGEQANALRKTLTSIASNAAQEGVQYEIERRQLTVPSDHPSAEALLAQGWERQGSDIVKPFVVKDAAEAMVIGAVIGGIGAQVAYAVESQPGPAQEAVKADAQAVAPQLPETLVRNPEGLPQRVFVAADQTFIPTPDATHTQPAYVNVVDPAQVTGDGAGEVVDAAQIIPAFHLDAALQAQAATPEGQTPPGIPSTTWQRWTGFLRELLPQVSSGGVSILRNQRGGIGRSRLEIRADIRAIETGGEEATNVLQRLGVETPAEASTLLNDEARQAEASAQAPAVQAGEPSTFAQAALAPQAGSSSGRTLAQGARLAEGLTPERYRTPDGRYRIPLKDLPSQELELQDLLRQPTETGATGIRLANETELVGEFTALLAPRESGVAGLLNNRNGLTPQAMAERAAELGFLREPTKQALLEALDRSLNQGQRVYSMAATGYVPLLDNPLLAEAYATTMRAVETMDARTAEQRRGVRPHTEVMAEAEGILANGGYSLDDVRELLPGTSLNDTELGLVVLEMAKLGVKVREAAQRFLDVGARDDSRELRDLASVMAMFAELDPNRRGVNAEAGRSLSFLNNPISAYNRFLDDLGQAIRQSPSLSWRRLAEKLVATPTAVERLQQAPAEVLQTQMPLVFDQLDSMHDLLANVLDTTPFPGVGSLTPLSDLAEEMSRRLEDLRRRGPETARAQMGTLSTAWQDIRARIDDLVSTEVATDDAGLLEQVKQLSRQLRRFMAQARGELGVPTALTPEQLAQREADWQAWLNRPYQLTAEPEQLAMLSEGEQERLLQDRAATEARFTAIREAERAAVAKEHAQRAAFFAEQRRREQEEPVSPRDLLAGPRDLSDTQTIMPVVETMLKVTAGGNPGVRGADYLLEPLYNAWLSNPATHLANLTGNLGTTLWVIPERWLAAGLSNDVQGVQRGEASAMLYGLIHGVQEAWALAARSWKLGTPVSGLSKAEIRPAAWTAENLGIDPSSALGQTVDFWFNYIGLPFPGLSAGRVPARSLMAADEFFKALNYRMELNALAYREAAALGYEGRAFAEHVERVKYGPSFAQTQEAAKSFAIIQSFQQPLGEGTLGAAVMALADVQAQGFPVGRLVIPFVQTPANITRYALERTPFGLFFQTVQADLDAGGAREAMARSKIALGTLTMLGALGYALAGRLTGRGPEDPELREAFLRQHPEYSLQLPGGYWVKYDRIDPVGMLLGMVADSVTVMSDEAIPNLAVRIPSAILYGFMKNITSKTYMQGLSDFFDAMGNRPGFARQHEEGITPQMARYVRQQASRFLQPSAFVAATARVFDPAQKVQQEFMDSLFARIPGFSRAVPAKRALNGDKVFRGYGYEDTLLVNLLRAYTPFSIDPPRTLAPADQEILANKMQLSSPPKSLYPHAVRVGEEPQLEDRDPTNYLSLTLTPAQYERFVVLAAGRQDEAQKLGVRIPDALLEQLTTAMGEAFTHPGGTKPPTRASLGQMLDWIVGTHEYRTGVPPQTGGAVPIDPNTEENPRAIKESIFRSVIHAYRQMGKQLLLAQDDALRQRYENTIIQDALDKTRRSQRPDTLRSMQEGFQQAMPLTRRALFLEESSGAHEPVAREHYDLPALGVR